jgi:hypothetical protein
MKPLPDLTDEAAMLLRGRRSALAAARSEAMIELRDAYTSLDGSAWADVAARAQSVRSHVERLLELAALWFETTAEADEAAMRREQS